MTAWAVAVAATHRISDIERRALRRTALSFSDARKLQEKLRRKGLQVELLERLQIDRNFVGKP